MILFLPYIYVCMYDKPTQTALFLCCNRHFKEDPIEMIKLLLDLGADPNTTDEHGLVTQYIYYYLLYCYYI